MEIKSIPIEVVKTSVEQTPNTFYGFWMLQESGAIFRKILRFSVKSFFPQYPAKKTSQEYLIEQVFQTLDLQGNVTEETVLQTGTGAFDVSGERFAFFQYISEVGQLRVPEHLINGLLDTITKTPYIFGQANPILVSRQYVDGNYAIEAYSQQYVLRQPMVCWIESITPARQSLPEGEEGPAWLENGSIELQVSEATNPLYSLDGSAFQSISIGQNIFSELSHGAHTLIVKDDVQTLTYQIEL